PDPGPRHPIRPPRPQARGKLSTAGPPKSVARRKPPSPDRSRQRHSVRNRRSPGMGDLVLGQHRAWPGATLTPANLLYKEKLKSFHERSRRPHRYAFLYSPRPTDRRPPLAASVIFRGKKKRPRPIR